MVNIDTLTTQVTSFEVPYPLDKKVLGGIAVIGSLSNEMLGALQERLQEAFVLLRHDQTSHYGKCIGYGWRLNEDDVTIVDEALIRVATAQNHGMLTTAVAGGDWAIWEGEDNGKRFTLQKRTGPIPLTTGEVPDGLVYSLHGSRPTVVNP